MIDELEKRNERIAIQRGLLNNIKVDYHHLLNDTKQESYSLQLTRSSIEKTLQQVNVSKKKQIALRTKVFSIFAKISKETSKEESLKNKITNQKVELIKEIRDLMNIRMKQENIKFSNKEVEDIAKRICDLPVKTSEYSTKILEYQKILEKLKESTCENNEIQTRELLRQLQAWHAAAKAVLGSHYSGQQKIQRTSSGTGKDSNPIIKVSENAPFSNRSSGTAGFISEGIHFISLIESLYDFN